MMRFPHPANPTAISGSAAVVPSLDIPGNPIGLTYLAVYDKQDRALVAIPVTDAVSPDETITFGARSVKVATDNDQGVVRDHRLVQESRALPSLRTLVEKLNERQRTVEISLDAALLAKIAKAVGTDTVRLELTVLAPEDFVIDTNMPIVVRPTLANVFCDGHAPVGLLMGIE